MDGIHNRIAIGEKEVIKVVNGSIQQEPSVPQNRDDQDEQDIAGITIYPSKSPLCFSFHFCKI